MRPDGAGTDERAPQGEKWPRPKSADALERHLITCAIAFAIIVGLALGGIYLSKRAVMPNIDENLAAQQEQP